jgi:hypothetical protein
MQADYLTAEEDARTHFLVGGSVPADSSTRISRSVQPVRTAHTGEGWVLFVNELQLKDQSRSSNLTWTQAEDH